MFEGCKRLLSLPKFPHLPTSSSLLTLSNGTTRKNFSKYRGCFANCQQHISRREATGETCTIPKKQNRMYLLRASKREKYHDDRIARMYMLYWDALKMNENEALHGRCKIKKRNKKIGNINPILLDAARLHLSNFSTS